MKRRRLWINIALIALIVIVIAAIAAVVLRPQQVEAPQRTATVAAATVTASVTASGSVESAGDLGLNFGSAGIVTAVEVEAGDQVQAGQVLATIEQTAAQQQVAAAESTLAQAMSSASTSNSGVANAQAQLALARESAKASNRQLDDAVIQATSNLTEAQKLWSDACVNPDDPNCAGASTAEAVRTAQNNVTTAQLAYDKKVELAASNAATYDLNVNHASIELQLQQRLAAKTCTDSGSDSAQCLSANNGTTSAENALESAKNARSTGLLADQQAIQSAQMSLSNANVALRKAYADSAKAGSDAVRQATQVLTNAKTAREKGRVANEQSVQSAENALTVAQAAVTPVAADADGAKTTPAQASVASARAALAVARQTLADTTIIAPVDGTVSDVNLSVGESSASTVSSAAAASAAAITLIPTGAFTAAADFAESDAAQVRIGDPAVVTFQALPDVSVTGTVLSVDPAATTSATNSLVTFRIVVSMQGVPETVRPGMTASIAITTEEVAGVLAVPQAALNSVGGMTTVEVLQTDNTTAQTQVQTGVKGDSLTEITAGVKAGDVLVIPTGTSGVSGFPQGGPPGGGPMGRPRN